LLNPGFAFATVVADKPLACNTKSSGFPAATGKKL
jgi:hypothetical protein